MWNQLDIIQTPPVVTSDFVYIRFLGDRSISETDFGTIQRNRVQEMAKWADKLKEVQKYERHVKTALVAANNHYAGFGPACMCYLEVLRNDHTQECALYICIFFGKGRCFGDL